MTAAEYRHRILGESPMSAGLPLPDACVGCRPGSLADIYRWQTEDDYRGWLEREALRAGWLVYHVTDSRKTRRGFPDLIIAREPSNGSGRSTNTPGPLAALDIGFAWEVKTMTGTARPGQMDWLRALDYTLDARLVRPCHAEWCIARLTGQDATRAPVVPRLVRDLDDEGRPRSDA